MSRHEELVEAALRRLAEKPGMEVRDGQRQLAHLISDCIHGSINGAFEAPTGLGKSLATLIPAIAHSIAYGRRVVIATYTNILTEQYWRKDLPFALSLFEGEELPSRQLLMGRQRYACLAEIENIDRHVFAAASQSPGNGIESEFRRETKMPAKEFGSFWRKVSAPPVCPGRVCEHYDACFYYKSRRRAEKAGLVITNHSVVIQDGLIRESTDGEMSMLGKMDHLILDEAHDFASAALNGLEIEFSERKLTQISSLAQRFYQDLLGLAQIRNQGREWISQTTVFLKALEDIKQDIASLVQGLPQSMIMKVSPPEVASHPVILGRTFEKTDQRALELGFRLRDEIRLFLAFAEKLLLSPMDGTEIPGLKDVREHTRNYLMYLEDYALGSERLATPEGLAVSYAGRGSNGPMLRMDWVGLDEPLKKFIWDKVSATCLSATLAIDNEFQFLKRTTGFESGFGEILPSPFDFTSQMAIYAPPIGRIPDPTIARKEGYEPEYYDAVAAEVQHIIEIMGGRTLVLFHSRKEMENVRERIDLGEEYPIFMQSTGAAASTVGERFKKTKQATLFGLRSFWTGFDAPGDTLSCVVVVRIPFEVPVEPAQIVRQAYMANNGEDGFGQYTIPMAKMLMRQGVGRLIRTRDDIGVVAVLDSRLRTKRYGESFIENLPLGARLFDDFADAAGHVGV